MLRLPNPGSNIDSFIRIFQALFEELEDKPTFTLDDMSKVLVKRNLATSCGFMGATALTRSTRTDRSRDPLYNQSKMYSELYRTLGWVHPQTDNRLQFNFTYLGMHVALAVKDPKSLFIQSALCIAYPNEVVEVKAAQTVRPFTCIIKTMSALDGLMCRDEMILGPLSIVTDRDPSAFSKMLGEIRSLRGNSRRLAKAMRTVSKQQGISLNTMYNYTRFPLAVLEWTGWTRKVRDKDVYHKSLVFHELIREGVATARWLDTVLDLRAKDLSKLKEPVIAATARFGIYRMLERAGFDTAPVGAIINEDLLTMRQSGVIKSGDSDIIFSPFHELSAQFATKYFPSSQRQSEPVLPKMAQASEHSEGIAHKVTGLVTLKLNASSPTTTRTEDALIRALKSVYQANGRDINKAADVFADRHISENQETFYPLVAHLFRILGYSCDHTRKGVNYARWDALILDAEESIPIEIKSPGEEQYLSVKSIRQAIENKVILLARKPFPVKLETTSLVVGYNLPNDRSEVNALIADVFKAYNITIGVIDFRSLVKLALAHLFENRRHGTRELKRLHGIVQVSGS